MSTASLLFSLAASVEASEYSSASFTVFGYGDEFEVAFEAEDPDALLPRVLAPTMQEVLEAAQLRAEEIAPGWISVDQPEASVRPEERALVDRAIMSLVSANFSLSYVPRSMVTAGPSWELSINVEDEEGGIVFMAPTLLQTLNDFTQGFAG
ncbi:hypothetical protein [Modestobacter sp. SYSU DS0511]